MQTLNSEALARVHDVPNENAVYTGPRLTELRFRVQKNGGITIPDMGCCISSDRLRHENTVARRRRALF